MQRSRGSAFLRAGDNLAYEEESRASGWTDASREPNRASTMTIRTFRCRRLSVRETENFQCRVCAVKAVEWNHGKAFRAFAATANYAYLDAHYDSFPQREHFGVGLSFLDGSE